MGNTTQTSLYGSRLVQILSDHIGPGCKISQGHFAERFGQLVDLSGSIALLRVHEELSRTEFQPTGLPASVIKDEFLRVRLDLLHDIAKSFVPGNWNSKGKLPTPAVLHSHFTVNGVYDSAQSRRFIHYMPAFEPYHQFYITRQRGMETKIQQLRVRVRKLISGCSYELAQLSMLDKALEDVLLKQTRNLFSGIPNLCGKRFGLLLNEHWHKLPQKPSARDLEPWMNSDGWIARICREMRELLLAELDVRLKPVLGMIESLPETDAADGMDYKGDDIPCG